MQLLMNYSYGCSNDLNIPHKTVTPPSQNPGSAPVLHSYYFTVIELLSVLLIALNDPIKFPSKKMKRKLLERGLDSKASSSNKLDRDVDVFYSQALKLLVSWVAAVLSVGPGPPLSSPLAKETIKLQFRVEFKALHAELAFPAPSCLLLLSRPCDG
jgi:hypothetical protein